MLGVLANDGHRLGEVADFVAAAGAGNLDVEIALGHPADAPFRRVMGRATPRKENTTEASSEMTTTIAMIRLMLVGTPGIGHDLVLGGLRILLRASDRGFHQVGDIRGGLDRAVGDDVVLIAWSSQLPHWRPGSA